MSATFTRDELYERVWGAPLRTIAAEIGVSDVGLRKACVKSQVPLPQQGYWAKLEAGKPAIRIKLGPRPPGLSEVVTIGGSRTNEHCMSSEDLLAEPIVEPVFAEPIEAVEERVQAAVGKVKPVKSLDGAHRAIKRYLLADDERREKQRKSGCFSSWDAPLFDGLFERRRFQILDAIFSAATRLGATVRLTGREARGITLTLNGRHIGIRADAEEYLKDTYHYVPFKTIAPGTPSHIRIGRHGGERWAWQDTKESKLEAHLSEMVFRLIMAAEILYRDERTGLYEWKLRRREQVLENQRLAREEEERRRIERDKRLAKARVDKLLGEAAGLAKAQTIRSYVERIRATVPETDATREWVDWALGVADTLDPIVGGRFLDRPTQTEN